MPKSMPKQKTSKPKVPPPISPAKWQAMTPRQRLLAIAKDVLAQLSGRRFKPTQGTYVRGVSEVVGGLDPAATREALLTKRIADCRACAVGAMWIGRIRLADGVRGNDVELDYDAVRDEIGRDTARDIEGYFEADADPVAGCDCEACKRAAMPLAKIKSPTTRLRAIMENIVAGRGVFDPARKARAAK